MSSKDKRGSEKRRLAISNYLYKKEGDTFLESYYLVIWNWMETKMPDWIAPSVITTVGLACNVLTTLLMMYYSPDAKSEVPSWVYVISALSIFTYLTLDSLDGKQCRRTNNDTALEELFDHGFDSLSTVFVILGSCISVQLGKHPELMMTLALLSGFMFYLVHWQCYCSGIVRFLSIDVIEGNTMIIILHALTALYGEDFWEYDVYNLGSLKTVMIYVVFLGAIYQFISQFSFIFKCGIHSYCGLNTVVPLLYFAFLVVLTVGISVTSPSRIFQNNPCLYLMCFGFAIATLTTSLLMSRLAEGNVEFPFTLLIGPAIMIFSQYWEDIITEYTALIICLALHVYAYVRFFTDSSTEICEVLNKYHFSVTSRPHPIQKDDTVYNSNRKRIRQKSS